MSALVVAGLIVGGGCVLGWWLNWRRQKRRRFISIAVLTTGVPTLDKDGLRSAAEAAWSFEFPQGEQATEWAVGEPPILMVKAAGFHFMVNVFARPYYLSGSAQMVERPAGFPPHAGWVSVDRLTTDEPQSDQDIYARIGRLVDALIDENAVAIYVPPTDAMLILATSERVAAVRAALRSGNVMEALERLGPGRTGGAATATPRALN